MRYIGLLKLEGGHREPQGVLITGYADPHTRRALEGRHADGHISWWVYGIKDDAILLRHIEVKPRDIAPIPAVPSRVKEPRRRKVSQRKGTFVF